MTRKQPSNLGRKPETPANRRGSSGLMGGHGGELARAAVASGALVFFVVACAVCWFPSWIANGQARPLSENESKARWCAYFLKFTEWPAGAFPSTNSPFVLGILGSETFGGSFDVLTNKPVRNRPVVLKKCQQVEEAMECHLLVLGSFNERRLAEILYDLKDTSILTIGENEKFTRMGGIVTFTLNKEQKFEISATAMKKAKLSMHSELREYGKTVP